MSRTQSLTEEIVNGFLHFIGLGLSIAGLVILIVLANNTWEVVGFSIYGSALILLYLSSTLYHTLPWPKVKEIFRVLDHSAIYLLIAGTYTPFVLTVLRGGWGWSLFGVIWGLACLGVILKCVCIDKFRILSVIFYLIMGWLVLIAIDPLLENLNKISLIFLFAGGIAYSLGVFFFAKDEVKHFHNIWHVFVIAGSVLHYFSVMLM